MIEYGVHEGTIERKIKIPLLEEAELYAYKLLGTAEGADKMHCLYMAHKYCTDFDNRVAGYRPAETTKGKNTQMAISFYEKKI